MEMVGKVANNCVSQIWEKLSCSRSQCVCIVSDTVVSDALGSYSPLEIDVRNDNIVIIANTGVGVVAPMHGSGSGAREAPLGLS